MAGRIELETHLTAQDDASKVIDKVADSAEQLERDEIEIPVTADDQASRTLEDVEEATEALTGLDAKIPISADDHASSDIAQVEDRLQDLTREDKQIILRGQADQLQREIADVNASLHKLSAQDVRVAIEARNNAQKDLDRVETKLRDLDGETATVKVESKGLDELSDKLGNMPGLAGQVSSAFAGGGGIATAAGAAAAAVGLAAKNFADMAVEAKVTADLTGATTEQASALQAVWGRTGADVKDLNDVLLQMNGVLQTSPDIASKLNVNLDDGRNIVERFLQVMQEIEHSTLSTTDKAQLMSQTFGEEGVRQAQKLLSVFGGAGGIQDAMDNISETRLISEEEAQQAVEFEMALQDVQAQVEAIANGLAGSVLPALSSMVELAGQTVGILQQVQEGQIFGEQTPGWLSEAVGWINPVTRGFKFLELGGEALNNVLGESEEITGSLAEGFGETAEASTEASAAVDAFVLANKPMSDLPATWNTAIEAVQRMRKGLEPTAAQMQAVTVLSQQYGITASEVFSRAAGAIDEQTAATEASAEAANEAAAAWQDYVSVVKSVDWQEADIIGATSAIEGYRGEMFALTNINADYQEAVDAFTQSLKDNGDTFDLNTEKGRANQDALEGIAAVLDTRLVAAYGDANGSLESFQQLSESAFQQLVSDLGLGAEQAELLRDQLNLTPTELETRYRLSQEAEAMQKLSLLQGAIAALPTDVQLQIGAMIAEGDIVGAAQLATSKMNEAVAGQPVVMPLTADPAAAQETIAAVQENEYTTVIDVTADPQPAEDTTEDFTSEQRETTPVDVLADDALAAAVLLTLISRRRETIIAVGTSGVPGVESTLNQVSRDRNTTINVGTSGVGAVDAALDRLTQSRSVTITPRVAPTTVLVRVDGGG